jgi:hypothetical protein
MVTDSLASLLVWLFVALVAAVTPVAIVATRPCALAGISNSRGSILALLPATQREKIQDAIHLGAVQKVQQALDKIGSQWQYAVTGDADMPDWARSSLG